MAWPAARLSSQSVTVTTAGGEIHLHAPGLRVIDGDPLARLKDGQSVRIELDLRVLPKPGAAPAVERKQAFVLSYDLWEERFAVTLSDHPSRSASHLTATAAEAWCVQQMSMPVSALGTLGRDQPFWIRLEYSVLDGSAAAPDEDGLTLRRLIDLLSRRQKAGPAPRVIEAGPFKVRE